jgi:hypothetical protein
LHDRLYDEFISGQYTTKQEKENDVITDYLKKFYWKKQAAYGYLDGTSLNPDANIIDNNISVVSEFYRYCQSYIQSKEASYASPTHGFIPISLGLSLDGISGIKIYNELKVSTRFLPDRYPESLHFIVKGVNHKLSNNDWETGIETVVISNGGDNGARLTYDQIKKYIDELLLVETKDIVKKPSSLSSLGIMDFTSFELNSVIIPPSSDQLTNLIKLMNKWGITNKLERAHFLAQCYGESGLKYTTEFSSGKQYDPPGKLAKRLGNTQKGDGPKFKGRGYIQLTGRNNYTAFNKYLKSKGYQDDVVKNPDLVATKYPGEASLFWWTSNELGNNQKVRERAKSGFQPESVIGITNIAGTGQYSTAFYPNLRENYLRKIRYFNYFKSKNI